VERKVTANESDQIENGEKMKTLRSLLCVFATGLLVVGGAQARSANHDHGHGCKNIHATGVGQDLGGGNTTATIRHGRPLNGTTSGHFVIGGAPPVFTISGTVTFTTKHGTLVATVAGTFDGSTGAFTASGPVSGGTGKLHDATGALTFTGVENLTTGAFTETITGTICRSHHN
jgi:hypothetical protein